MKISTVPLVGADGKPTGDGDLTMIELTTDEVSRALRMFVNDQMADDDWRRVMADGDGSRCRVGGLPDPLRRAEVHIGCRSIDMINGARVVVKARSIGDHGGECVTIGPTNRESFLAALDAAFAPTFVEVTPDPIVDVDAVIERLDRLRNDMATVGGNALVEAVRDLAIAIRGVCRG